MIDEMANGPPAETEGTRVRRRMSRRKAEEKPKPVAAIPRVDDPPPPPPEPKPPPTPEEIVAGLWQHPGLGVDKLVAAGKELAGMKLSAEQLTMLAVGVPGATSGLTAQRCQRVISMLTRLASAAS